MPITLSSENWEPVWSHTEESVTNGDYFYPIEDFLCPVTLTNQYCLVTAVSAIASQTWRTAGYCSMVVNSNSPAYGVNTAYVESKLLFFGQNLLIYPDVTNSYKLLFGVKPWVRQLTIDVQRYIGPIVETYDPILEQIRDAVI
jgi:hypothetical protein